MIRTRDRGDVPGCHRRRATLPTRIGTFGGGTRADPAPPPPSRDDDSRLVPGIERVSGNDSRLLDPHAWSSSIDDERSYLAVSGLSEEVTATSSALILPLSLR